MAIDAIIEPMSVVAFIAGLVVCYLYLYKFLGVIFSLVVMSFYRSKERFMNFYGLADDELTAEYVKLDGINTYADYLRLHAEMKDSAYSIFKDYYLAAVREIVKLLLIYGVLPAFVFWTSWYWYIAGSFTLLIVGSLVSPQRMHNGVGFFRYTMLIAIFKQYLDGKEPK